MLQAAAASATADQYQYQQHPNGNLRCVPDDVFRARYAVQPAVACASGQWWGEAARDQVNQNNSTLLLQRPDWKYTV